VLHPRHKLTYFKNQDWPQDWINTALEIVREEFNRRYRADVELVEKEADTEASEEVSSRYNYDSHSHPHLCFQKSSGNIFDNLAALAAPKRSDLRDELSVYLSADPEMVTDALLWWYDKRQLYPTLSRMALDYLSVPGTFLINFPC